jgi:hypothetical protein
MTLASFCSRWAPSEPRLPKNEGLLTALPLAYNLFGDSFFETGCRLGGKSMGRCL